MAVRVLSVEGAAMHGDDFRADVAFAIPPEQLDKGLICALEDARAIPDNQPVIIAAEMEGMKGKANFDRIGIVPLQVAKDVIALAAAGRPMITDILTPLEPVFVSN